MCGFTISKEKLPNLIKHRGITVKEERINEWVHTFNSLPLSSYKLGLEQPLLVENYCLSFNGEIFNYKDLDKRSLSDLDYLRRLIKKSKDVIKDVYKESLKWDGFWSVCLADRKGDLYFFTDPLGKKQLYYNDKGISSEIKTLLDNDSILKYDVSKFGTLNTPFSTVERCLPGKLYKYEIFNSKCYSIADQDYIGKSCSNNLYQLIDNSVKLRTANRIDGVTLFLSGGLDSNIVLHHLLKQDIQVEILSIENGETDVVNRIANDYGLDIKFIKDSYTENDLKKAIYHYEHPYDLGSLIPNYLLFKNASNSVILTGDGSDEFFQGYNRSKTEDTWKFDVLKELPYYHNIRLDRMSMAFTKEARSPLMSNELLTFSYLHRSKKYAGKKILRDLYREMLPDYVIQGNKKPLRFNNDKKLNMDLVKTNFNKVWQKARKK